MAKEMQFGPYNLSVAMASGHHRVVISYDSSSHQTHEGEIHHVVKDFWLPGDPTIEQEWEEARKRWSGKEEE